MSKETIMTDIQEVEKGIKASEELRQHALTSKGFYEKQLKETDQELTTLGTTAEDGQKEIELIDAKIEQNLLAIKNMIPFDLLREYKRL
jgi:F0F1-type ATP synthase membrane subunit b/b'